MLDGEGRVLRSAKLWNDMETAGSNQAIIEEAGGTVAVAKRLGTSLPVGYTASKVRWMLDNDRETYEKTRHVMTPHDYLNYWLTGRAVMEPGDGSGTGYYQVVKKTWDMDMVNLIDPTGVLASALPELIESEDCVGPLRAEAAEKLGLSASTLVCGGSGDNEMGAFGTGNVSRGDSTVGLGTSGVLNNFSENPLLDFNPVMQVFAAAGGGWLATTCTVNATSSTTSMQKMFGMDLDAFTSALESSPPGAEGLRLYPFFNGERMPPLPTSRGTMTGMTNSNLAAPNFIRATAEAVIYTLKWGYDRQLETLPRPELLRLTGGGAGNRAWRQIIADVFDTDAICLVHDEGGAFGAALLSMLMILREKNGIQSTPKEICDKYVLLDEQKRIRPIKENVERYKELYARYDAERRELYGQ
jgi:Sugar (pentulose and hexulose) kinases